MRESDTAALQREQIPHVNESFAVLHPVLHGASHAVLHPTAGPRPPGGVNCATGNEEADYHFPTTRTDAGAHHE
jgi:hypothetical protein